MLGDVARGWRWRTLVGSLAIVLGAVAPYAAGPRTAAHTPASTGESADAPDTSERWPTPAERSDFRATPDYDETLQTIRDLARMWPAIDLQFFGTSAEGRPLPVVVVSPERAFTPGAAQATGKAVVLIQNGIHAGEIDGKDASLMLLRDWALGRHRDLLDGVLPVIVPIYNVDGHERVSPHNRPNQNGPQDGMGFRTTSDGHDLNRDHLKLDTPEARAMIGLFNHWQPQLHIDNHVTDGVDHDWVLTYSWIEAPQAPLPLDSWLRAVMPAAIEATRRAGHRLGPYVSLIDGTDPTRGFDSYVGEPRYATGYYPLRNVPSILVENHAPKPYRERVLANRDFMLALLAQVARDPAALREAVLRSGRETAARGRVGAQPSTINLRYRVAADDETHPLPIYRWFRETSRVTGAPFLRYEPGNVQELDVPWRHRPRPELQQPRPRGYLVLPGWPEVERRIADHGLRFRRLEQEFELEVETLRVSNPVQGPRSAPSYQGRTRIAVDVQRRLERRRLPPGALWIPADQPDFEVAVQLLEPEAPDSLVSWGALSIVLEHKEYIDVRGLERLAAELLEDPAIAAEWRDALEDPTFAADGQQRYFWWYRRTPYHDEQVGLLPILRLLSAPPFDAATPLSPAPAGL